MKHNNLRSTNQFWREQKNATEIRTADNFTKNLWRKLLGTLIGDKNRIPEMRQYLSADDMPMDMLFEREVFRVLHECNERGLPPTRENVLTGVVVRGEVDLKQEDVEFGLDKMIERRSIADSGIESLSSWLSEATKSLHNEKAWKVALDVINSDRGLAHERQEAAMNIVTSATKEDEAFESGTASEINSEFLDWVDQRYKDAQAGNIVSGPLLPWYGFIGAHGILPAGADWGDMTLITAQSGFGKSTIVGQVAEYNALDVQTSDVLVILLETNLMKMEARSYARNCMIPFDMVKSAAFNSRDPRFHKDIKGGDYRKTGLEPAKGSLGWYENWVESSNCEINYAFAPGTTAYQITQLIGLYRRKAEARDRNLLVIVDYLQKIDWTIFGYDQRVGLERVADVLRDGIEIQNNKSPVHMIMMAQENEGSDPYGGRGILQRAQLHLSLNRTRRVAGEMLQDGDMQVMYKGKQVHDTIGNPRWYQRATDMLAADSAFVVRKANDAPGREIKVRFENSKYRIHHHPSEYKKHQELSQNGG